MRRFEFTRGASEKFWEVEVSGAELEVHFGKLGTKGQSKRKSFAGAVEAEAALRALVKEKLEKGYVEVGAKVAAPAPPPGSSKPATSAKALSIVQKRLVDGAGGEWVVTLFERSVVIGEAGERRVQVLSSRAAAQEHFERLAMLQMKEGFQLAREETLSAEEFRPPDALERAAFEGKLTLESGRCVITFEGDEDQKISARSCEALVERIEHSAPRSVQLIADLASPRTEWERALGGKILPSIESFIFDTPFQTPARQARNALGDLSAVLGACPELKKLLGTGNLKMSATAHSKLRALHLLPAHPSSLALEACEFPALERIAIALPEEGLRPASALGLLAKIAAMRAPVREVHLDGISEVARFLDGALAAGLPGQWEVLTLGGTSTDTGDEGQELEPVLRKHAASLGSLKVLGLPVFEDVAERLRATWPCVRDREEWRALFLPEAYADW